MKKKVSIIGLFCTGKEVADGQSIKTRIVTRELERTFGKDNIRRIDTYEWKKNPLKLFISCIRAVYESSNVIFMTDAGGIKVFPWLFSFVNVFNKTKVYYVVIGGWLVHFLENHTLHRLPLKRLDGIFVETQIMKDGLEKIKFNNVELMLNFKDLTLLPKEDIVAYSANEPYKFCLFSRIMREKGVEYAVDAVKNINELYGREICILDIYGPVDPKQKEWFERLKNTFSSSIRYCGIVPFDNSVEVLKEYYALLFPTLFYTEGIPGTIIDAYAAAVPVVASEWESVFDIVEPGVTGVSYPFDNPRLIQDCMVSLIENPAKVMMMKEKCLMKAECYLPNAAMGVLISKLNSK